MRGKGRTKTSGNGTLTKLINKDVKKGGPGSASRPQGWGLGGELNLASHDPHNQPAK